MKYVTRQPIGGRATSVAEIATFWAISDGIAEQPNSGDLGYHSAQVLLTWSFCVTIHRLRSSGITVRDPPGRVDSYLMARLKLRDSIATEAARLLLRGTEIQYPAARRRAARWLSRRRLDADDLPTYAEIRSQVYALSGLFPDEQRTADLRRMQSSALELMDVLAAFAPQVHGCAVDGPAMPGAEIAIDLWADSVDEVVSVLQTHGFRPQPNGGREPGLGEGQPARLQVHYGYPCELTIRPAEPFGPPVAPTDRPPREAIDAGELRGRLSRSARDAVGEQRDDVQAGTGEHEYHPDAFAMFRMLLERLEQVQLDLGRHPEGDALYHSLQVYELALAERPYDEELLLAALLHDAGLAIDRRNPVPALLDAVGGLLTERTRFLIENLDAARGYLNDGRIARSLRRSEHFEELVLLARCDVEGRVPGAAVSELDEALEEIAGMSTAWDDV